MKRKGTFIFHEFRKFLRQNDIPDRNSVGGESFYFLGGRVFYLHFKEENILQITDGIQRKERFFRIENLNDVLVILCSPYFKILPNKYLPNKVRTLDYYEIIPEPPREYFMPFISTLSVLFIRATRGSMALSIFL